MISIHFSQLCMFFVLMAFASFKPSVASLKCLAFVSMHLLGIQYIADVLHRSWSRSSHFVLFHPPVRCDLVTFDSRYPLTIIFS